MGTIYIATLLPLGLTVCSLTRVSEHRDACNFLTASSSQDVRARKTKYFEALIVFCLLPPHEFATEERHEYHTLTHLKMVPTCHAALQQAMYLQSCTCRR